MPHKDRSTIPVACRVDRQTATPLITVGLRHDAEQCFYWSDDSVVANCWWVSSSRPSCRHLFSTSLRVDWWNQDSEDQEQEQDTTGATISHRPPSQIQPFLYFYIDNNPVFIRYTDCFQCRNVRSLCSVPHSVYCSHCRQNIRGRCHWSPLDIVYQIVRCRQCFWSIDHPSVGIDTVAGDVVGKERRKTKR